MSKTLNIMLKTTVFIYVIIFQVSITGAESPSPAKKTAAKIMYYYDSRDYSTLEIFTSTTALPYRLSVWGFTDIHSATRRNDLTRYFSDTTGLKLQMRLWMDVV